MCCLGFCSSKILADDLETYVVGAQNIGYFPHYDFRATEDKGFAWALLEEFAKHQGIRFVYIALPIKRLQVALQKGVVDFAYPDNPKWGSNNTDASGKHFSTPLTIAMGSTIVRRHRLGNGLNGFDSLAVPFGFTPVKWLSLVQQNKVRLVQVQDADAALELVMLERVSGADVEFHVARHQLLQSPRLSGLTMDPELPYDIVGFSLSSYRHQALILKLDNFILNEEKTIASLKRQYRIESTETILKQLQGE